MMSQFFWCCVLLCWPWLASANCPTLLPDEIVTVARVVDGDTIVLQDGRVIRLIGIDTPELKQRQSLPLAAGAQIAKTWLQNKMPSKSRLKLVFGAERRDDYGRWLAHPLTEQGQLLVKEMLELGLGSLLQIPPNHGYWSCLLEAEQRARQQALGIWPTKLPNLTLSRRQAGRSKLPQERWFQTRVVRAYSGTGQLKLELENQIILMAGATLPAAARRQLTRLKQGDPLFIRGQAVGGKSFRRQTSRSQTSTAKLLADQPEVNRRDQPVLWLNYPWQFYPIKQ